MLVIKYDEYYQEHCALRWTLGTKSRLFTLHSRYRRSLYGGPKNSRATL